MAEKNKIEVFIGGKIYKILGEESEEYLQKVARYIDKKMAEISRTDRPTVVSNSVLSILTAINVADDYFKMKEQNETLMLKVEENSDSNQYAQMIELYEQELGKLQEENMALKAKLDQVMLELSNAKTELNNYIEAFDLNNQKL
jgi:cell division protein ZapA